MVAAVIIISISVGANMGAEELPLQWHVLTVAGRGTNFPFLSLN